MLSAESVLNFCFVCFAPVRNFGLTDLKLNAESLIKSIQSLACPVCSRARLPVNIALVIEETVVHCRLVKNVMSASGQKARMPLFILY